jgi:hypothetical protein
MRSLVLLTLVALAAIPLSAHDHWRSPRRVVVVAESHYAPYHRWDDRRWDHDRWERRSYDHRYDCDDDRVILRPLPLPRPLAPPFPGRVELWLR